MVHVRMLQGTDGYFLPEETLTSEEASVLLYRLYNLLPYPM
ncbi:hypothetical protein [Paenibacillus sp. JNUCC32]|nr:hypothetical protein [Paenibacillus sp. JNUCC-32]